MTPRQDDRTNFSQIVEQRAIRERISHIEALTAQCEEQGIEPDTVKKLISAPLKAKLKAEAQALHYLPGGRSRLPLEE